MLYMSWQTLHVNVSHLVVLYKSHKEPKRDFLAAVQQKGTYYEVHTLDVAYGLIVLRKSLQDSLKALLAFTSWLLENFLMRECPRDVAFDLSFFCQTNEVFDSQKVQVALATLLNLELTSMISHLKPAIC